MSIFYDQDTSLQPKFNERWSKGERTNFLENWDSQHEAWKKSEIFTSEHNNESEEFINIISILKQAGHSDFVNPIDEFLKIEPLGSGSSSIFGVNSFNFSKKKNKR